MQHPTPTVQSWFHAPTFTATHSIIDPQTRHCAILDSVLDFDYASGRAKTEFADKIVAFVGDGAFVGDTLFMPDYGTARCDFPGGDAHVLYQSVHKLYSLPPQTKLYLCHDYMPGGREPIWQTTVQAEREGNVQLNDRTTEEEFVAFRKQRNAKLSMPALILPAVQINVRAGELPRAEANGRSYLKVPLGAL